MTGAPTSRRDVLRVGGLAIATSALVAACSSDRDRAAPDVEADATETPTTGAPDSGTDDVSLLNTALSLAVLIIDTYQVGFDFSLVTSGPAVEAVTRFRQHHGEHRDVLIAAVEAAGAEPFTTANPVVKAALVDPSLVSVTVEEDFITLARDLEQAAAQLHVHAATLLSTPELRSIAMSIAGVDARHTTILDLLGDLGKERVATYPTDNPLPSDAVVSG